jgi:nucleoside-triphosphatase THEP1
MKPARIVILTGAKQSGKSSTLLTWIENKNVGGFLSPVVSGKRMLFSLPEKVYLPFESTGNHEQSISVGRYQLLKSTFQLMNKHLVEQSGAMFDWLVIDEIGPLELNEEGVYPGLMHVLHNSQNSLLLVVREGLVEQVIQKFIFNDAEVISKEYLI